MTDKPVSAQERDEFEDYCVRLGIRNLSRDETSGVYCVTNYEQWWRIWQAARAQRSPAAPQPGAVPPSPELACEVRSAVATGEWALGGNRTANLLTPEAAAWLDSQCSRQVARTPPAVDRRVDERAKFEAWQSGPSCNKQMIERDEHGQYVQRLTMAHWEAWQARAALDAMTQPGEET